MLSDPTPRPGAWLPSELPSEDTAASDGAMQLTASSGAGAGAATQERGLSLASPHEVRLRHKILLPSLPFFNPVI